MTRLLDLETIEMGEDVRHQAQSALGAWYFRVRERDIKDGGTCAAEVLAPAAHLSRLLFEAGDVRPVFGD